MLALVDLSMLMICRFQAGHQMQWTEKTFGVFQ